MSGAARPPSTGRGLSHWSEASHIWEGMLNRVGEGGINYPSG